MMITPPVSTPSFYTVLFTADAGTEVLKFLIPQPGADIENVLVTSLDLDSDVQATVECDVGSRKIAALVNADADHVLKFNPLYLPNYENLCDELEYDANGDLIKVAGFGNPFVTANFKFSAENQPEFIDANICYKQFDLPTIGEVINETKVLLS